MGNVFIKCGKVLRCDETTLYLVNGRLFEECEEDSENEDEIVQWGDGKYYKRFLLDSKKELEKSNFELKNEKLELKSKNEEYRGKLNKYYQKEGIKILKHMESLNGEFSEYINNADDNNFQNIQTCCKFFMELGYETTKRGREK